MKRRKFLQNASAIAYGSGAAATITNLKMLGTAAAQTSGSNSEYKALICIFLPGGMDSFNALMPGANHPELDNYNSNWGDSGFFDSALPLGSDNQFAINEKLKSFQELYNNSSSTNCKGAMIANVGSLLHPLSAADIANIRENNDHSKVPLAIGSHNDQQEQWQTLDHDGAQSTALTGWLARLADSTNNFVDLDANNYNGAYSHISLSGNNFSQGGLSPLPYAIGGAGGAKLMADSRYHNPAVKESVLRDWAKQSEGCDEFLGVKRSLLEAEFAQSSYSSNQHSTEFNTAFEEANNFAIGGGDTFSDLEAQYRDVGDEKSGAFKAVARIWRTILASSQIGFNEQQTKRQTFFLKLGGWDHHFDIVGSLPGQLNQLNEAFKAFRYFQEKLNINATVFTASDFGRTLTPNNPSLAGTVGTDHAWGGNMFVAGPDVNGGNVYGDFPTLNIGTGRDISLKGRGILAPTTSLYEYYAELANWFGLPEDSPSLDDVFPYLSRFSGNPPLNFMS